MGTRPLIGLTGGRIGGRDIAGNLAVLGDSPVDVFYADYSRAVVAAGGLPVFLPLDVGPAEIIGSLDGLLLTGGDDIAPECYDAVSEPETHAGDPTRDRHELAVLDQAVAHRLPTVGICRGLQLVNVWAGGTLHQHVPEHAFLDEPGSVEQHEVTMEVGSVLAQLFGARRFVNSLHHQSIDRLGNDLRATATSADGGIEGVEHRTTPMVAVQWHPEMLPSAATDPLFAWLVEAACPRSTSR